MSPSVTVILDVALFVTVAVAFAVIQRELRALRRGLGAVDEAEGRRAATLLAGLQALREPIDAVRTVVDELSPERRETVERMLSSPPMTAPPVGAGLRLDLPRASDEERDSDGETRLVRQPTAEELAAAGAVPDPPALAAAGLGRPRAAAPPHPPPKRVRTQTGTLMSMPAQVQPPASAPQVSVRAVCRMCEGSGVVRARNTALEVCRGCDGAGYVDPSEEQAPPGVAGREARLPG